MDLIFCKKFILLGLEITVIIYLFEAKHKQHRHYIGLKREESKDHIEPYYPETNQQLGREPDPTQAEDISGCH